MGYYRAGGIEPGDTPEVPLPDPLADDPTRAANLLQAYGRMRRAKEDEMGYYRAGGAAYGGNPYRELAPDTGSVPASHVLGEGIRRHRMNPMNVRAARRSIRRLDAFARIASRIYAFRHKARAGGHFKHKRKKRS